MIPGMVYVGGVNSGLAGIQGLDCATKVLDAELFGLPAGQHAAALYRRPRRPRGVNAQKRLSEQSPHLRLDDAVSRNVQFVGGDDHHLNRDRAISVPGLDTNTSDCSQFHTGDLHSGVLAQSVCVSKAGSHEEPRPARAKE